MAYSELIKKFDKIRAYMRDFYVYGFKSRVEYDLKSARSYDDERRRIESWLGDYMRFTKTAEGKNVFLSVDSRINRRNPFYKAWKAKSFTDGDITLHFMLFDILHDPSVKMTLTELLDAIDRLITDAGSEMTFDESTLRKKLKEYAENGIIQMEKQGRAVRYSRAGNVQWSQMADAVDFFSEVAPIGVVGSFLQDKLRDHESIFSFKHHYITQAMDSGILAQVFHAMREKRYITIENLSRHLAEVRSIRLVPIKVYISAQNGRQYLIALNDKVNRINAYRMDYILSVREEEICEKYGRLMHSFQKLEPHAWGVNFRWATYRMEHVEFDITVAADEGFIIKRLEREKRCGTVEQVDECTWRYTAEVFDTQEMLPWIRTFISRISRMHFSNRTAENQFKNDLQKMYRMYGVDGGEES
ncbi:MAG: WYL domain-containing protein [Clostridiales bacterium]|nr:WYL domain-containing protein [Clostridiales bacterium]